MLHRHQDGWPASNASRSNAGWTLAELLIVVAIFAILAILFLLVNWKRNVFRAHDAQRKTDLANIRRAFEEYYNDKDCYPPLTMLNNCGGADLTPYLAKIPCDPTTREPYKYQPDSETNVCLGNRVCAKLQDFADPDITTLGCHPQNGCGWGPYWNYCLATGATIVAPGFNPGLSPTPSPSPTPSYMGPYACRPGTVVNGQVVSPGICNNVGTPETFGCPRSWAESDCQGLCADDPSMWCAQ